MRLDDNSFDYKPLFSDIEKQKGLSNVKHNESILQPEEKSKDLTRASNIAEQLLEQLTLGRVQESDGNEGDDYRGQQHLRSDGEIGSGKDGKGETPNPDELIKANMEKPNQYRKRKNNDPTLQEQKKIVTFFLHRMPTEEREIMLSNSYGMIIEHLFEYRKRKNNDLILQGERDYSLFN